MDLWLMSITISRACEFITAHDRPHSGSAAARSPGGVGPLRGLWPTNPRLVDVVGGQPVRLGRPCPPDPVPGRLAGLERRAA